MHQGGFGERKKKEKKEEEDWQQTVAQVPIFKKYIYILIKIKFYINIKFTYIILASIIWCKDWGKKLDWITKEVTILFENGSFLWLSARICKDSKLTVSWQEKSK